MTLVDKIQASFFKSQVFRGLLSKYVTQPDSVVVSKALANDQVQNAISTSLPDLVTKGVHEELEKLQTFNRNEAMRYRMPYNMNSNTNPDLKPMGTVPFSYLRRMANTYPIARACINRRIRQITQLAWDITTADDLKDEKGYEDQIAAVKMFFKTPMGHKTRMREMLTIMVDDVLQVDAVTFEMQRTRGGEFMHLIPVDPTTIALRVTEHGATPEPPDAAYVQFIQGQQYASFTTDEMIYEMMGSRSYSPYGLAPLESLVLQVESAIRGALYNLNYLKENNVPEGFLTLPDEIATNKNQVEEWQMWFDAMVAGDPKFTHRLKILPGGTEYQETKKMSDMAFERFELWLLQQTCAVFDVPPQDIGITYQVNKATSESQSDLSRERGLIPLGNFIKEMLDSIIQEQFGFTELQFMWRNINPTDRKEEIEIAEKEIKQGSLSVDEYRIAQGLDPIGLGHYIMTTNGPMMVKDFVAGKVGPLADGARQDTNAKLLAEAKAQQPQQPDGISPDAQQRAKMELTDLKRWRKCILNDLEDGKELRTKFPSEYIDQETHDEIVKALKGVNSKTQARLLFDEYIDPEVKASMTLLRYAGEIRKLERTTAAAN